MWKFRPKPSAQSSDSGLSAQPSATSPTQGSNLGLSPHPSSFSKAALIVAAAWYVYSPCLRGDWLWDDFEILDNPNLRDWSGLLRMWYAPAAPDYAPLKTTVLWLEWHLWGENRLAYHLTNLALHVAAAFLLWHVLYRLRRSFDSAPSGAFQDEQGVRFATTARPDRKPGAGFEWLAALLLVVHPVAVESVAWIAEMKNILSLVLLLLAISAYLIWDRKRGIGFEPMSDENTGRMPVPLQLKSRAATQMGGATRPCAANEPGASFAPDGAPGTVRPTLSTLAATDRDAAQASPPAISTTAGGTPALLWYTLSFLLFTAALLVKSAVVMFPAILLLYAWWRWGAITGRDLRASLPFFAVSAILGAVTVWFQLNRAIGDWDIPQESFMARFADAGRALTFYFWKCVFPRNLMPIYPPWTHTGPAFLPYLPWVLIAVLVGWGGAHRPAKPSEDGSLRCQLGEVPLVNSPGEFTSGSLTPYVASQGPVAPPKVAQASPPAAVEDAGADAGATSNSGLRSHPSVSALHEVPKPKLPRRSSAFSGAKTGCIIGLAWFVLFLLPVLGFIPMSYQHVAPVADHLCYLSLVGLVALATAGIGAWHRFPTWHGFWGWHGLPAHDIPTWAGSPCHSKLPLAKLALISAIIPALAIESHRYAKIFINQETLWTYNLKHNTRSSSVYLNLGFILHHDGNDPAAIANYEQAIRLDPNDAQAENDLADVYAGQNRIAEALPHYRRAAAIYSTCLKPDSTQIGTRRSLAKALAKAGQTQEAIAQYERILREDPEDAEIETSLGKALSDQGDVSQAITHFQNALLIDPGYWDAENSLGMALIATGRPADGIKHIEEALRLHADFPEAENNLGFALVGQGRQQEAIGHFEEALRLKPAFGKAENNLGLALAVLGRRDEAIAHLDHALQLTPGDPKAHYNLAVLLAAAGRYDEAIAHVETALRLKPDFTAAQSEIERLKILKIASGR